MPRHKLNDAARDMMNNLEGSGNSVQRCLAKLWLAADGIYELRQNTGQLKRLVESSLEDYSRLLKKAHEAIGHLFSCEFSDSVDFNCEGCNAAREVMQEIEATERKEKNNMTKQDREKIVSANNNVSKLISDLREAHGNTEDVALEILLFDMIEQIVEVKIRLRRLSHAQ